VPQADIVQPNIDLPAQTYQAWIRITNDVEDEEVVDFAITQKPQTPKYA